MSRPRTAAEVLSEHVVLELESVDRMYLKVMLTQWRRTTCQSFLMPPCLRVSVVKPAAPRTRGRGW